MGEILHKVRTGHPFWTMGFLLLIAFFIVFGVLNPGGELIEYLILAFVAFSLLLAFPDMHAHFGMEGILLTFGIGGIWKKRVRIENIQRVSVERFSGLRHFGGWGIKYGIGKFLGTLMWGMPVRGSRGIWVETSSGRNVLIPDPNPEVTMERIKAQYPVDNMA